MQTKPPKTLPRPDATSASHSEKVATHMQQQIDSAGGHISFAQFMHEALYAPGLGYYSAGATKFGASGDFVTAPEVSVVFGRVVARQCAEVLADLGGGDILEIGAGSGKLATDMLQALNALGQLPRYYYVLEVSADLVDRQRRRIRDELPELIERVVWLTEFPQDFAGVVLANEVLDALPVERFAKRGNAIMQVCVTGKDGVFGLAERAAPAALLEAVQEIETDLGAALPDGYMSELALPLMQWLADISASVSKGVVMLFDYGVSRREYYAPDRTDGWLRCHFRHHAHNDALLFPGIQDITSWVDFSAVAGAAVASGMDILGYQTQAQFLLGGGLEQEMRQVATLSVDEQLKLSGEIKKLTLPGEMGENFKCMALGRGDVTVPHPFRLADRTHTL